VSKEYKGQKLGSLVLNLLKRFFVTNNNSGCRFFTLDAYREAKDFYLKNNFIPALLQEDDENPKSPTIPMYFDLKRIEL
jgi:hypothetical protein